MLEKTDKPTQNSALQGILEQENFMIKVLFICHGIIFRFRWKSFIYKHFLMFLKLFCNSFATFKLSPDIIWI